MPPGLRLAAAPSRSPVCILRDCRFGIHLTGKPPRVHLPHVVCDGASFLLLRSGIGLRLLPRQLAGMHDDKAHLFLGDPSLTVFDFDAAEYAVPMPTARRFVLGPSRLLH